MHVSASVVVFSYTGELGRRQETEEHSGPALQQHSPLYTWVAKTPPRPTSNTAPKSASPIILPNFFFSERVLKSMSVNTMLRAAETGDLASVEAAIAAGVDVLSKDGAKNTAVRRRVLCMRRWPAHFRAAFNARRIYGMYLHTRSCTSPHIAATLRLSSTCCCTRPTPISGTKTMTCPRTSPPSRGRWPA